MDWRGLMRDALDDLPAYEAAMLLALIRDEPLARTCADAWAKQPNPTLASYLVVLLPAMEARHHAILAEAVRLKGLQVKPTVYADGETVTYEDGDQVPHGVNPWRDTED